MKAKLLLALIVILSLFAGCTTPVAPTSDPLPIEDGVLLPFDANGNFVWSTSDISDVIVQYWNKQNEGQNLIAILCKESNVKALEKLMSKIDKSLIMAEKKASQDERLKINDMQLGDTLYSFRKFNGEYTNFLYVYKAEDCGHLWFERIHKTSKDECFHQSLYKINLNDLQKIEDFFEALDIHEDFPEEKPVLYLYPEHEQDVSVTLNFDGRLTVTYPAYDDGWNVRAYPDGRLINKADGLEYSYLFWEGIADNPGWDFSEGYCVAGADTAHFLQKTLGELGLTPKEYNEFIVYWLPQMQDNAYNLITFQWEEYERTAPLIIAPAPDSVLRVFMVFKALDKPADIERPARRDEFSREGFTVVEWGGSKVSR